MGEEADRASEDWDAPVDEEGDAMTFRELIEAVRAKIPSGVYHVVGVNFTEPGYGASQLLWKIYRSDMSPGWFEAPTGEAVLALAFPAGVDLVDADQVVPAPAAAVGVADFGDPVVAELPPVIPPWGNAKEPF